MGAFVVNFFIPPLGEPPPTHYLTPEAALARLSKGGADGGGGGGFTVAFSRSPASLRRCVPVLSAVAAAGARAAFDFPPLAPGETPFAHAARLVGLMFEQGGAPAFPLRELRLAPEKAAKTHVNHRAELYLWISANGVDWPRHQPLWRAAGRDGRAAEVTEGSSTFLALLANLGPAVAAGLAVPCEERAALPAAGAEPDPER